MKFVNKEEIIEIIKIAFKDGEQWGVTHHDWFVPTESQIEERINQTIKDIFKMRGLED